MNELEDEMPAFNPIPRPLSTDDIVDAMLLNVQSQAKPVPAASRRFNSRGKSLAGSRVRGATVARGGTFRPRQSPTRGKFRS